ncbi:MAG: hypothetical protein IPK72_14115 [Candidatus Eisenbacteria bacterium]|nr:hypothetical protein [Candidatus Eisenbacteria bacterium]
MSSLRSNSRQFRVPLRLRVAAGVTFLVTAAGTVRGETDNFESPPVHPVEISPDGTRLYVAHLAGNSISVFDLAQDPPALSGQIPVGIDPVTVRARGNDEIWVVSPISDSVSRIDLSLGAVTHTIEVGDRPTDLVFAGGRAFVCVAGENRLVVLDPDDPAAVPQRIELRASEPRALAVSSDGSAVFVAAFDSGNQTTAVPYLSVEAGGGAPPPHPPMRPGLPIPPRVALIVKHDGTHWRDEIGRNWDSFVPYRVLDHDVLQISTTTLAVERVWGGVGTTLLDLAVHPTSGRIYVTNLEARNDVRFVPNLRGSFAQNRITVIDPVSGAVTPVHLNPHINYASQAGTPGERALSLSTPMEIAVRSDGSELFVAAFGSRKVAVLDPGGQVLRRIPVGQGPAGLALDEERNRLYVYNRHSSTISLVDLVTDQTTELAIGYDPTPIAVRLGRKYMYDGEISSSHGDLSCGSCHLFGGMDKLAWDLGDPEGEFEPPPGPGLTGDHPMKGPMITQSMKALADTEPFHWRGDRFAFSTFNANFVALMGREAELPEGDFNEFTEFTFSMRYPPNPNRQLDGSLPDPPAGANPRRGETLFREGRLFGQAQCTVCHSGEFGTNTGLAQAEFLRSDQDLKVPQMRNLFEKTGLTPQEGWALRGFGYGHDGVFPDVFSFLDFELFDFRGPEERRDVEAFCLAFDTGTHAATGAQWTDRGAGDAAGELRLATLRAVADQNAIGLIAKGIDLRGEARGWHYRYGEWWSDRIGEPAWTTGQLLALGSASRPVTFTAVVPGTETRLGIDRDEDGYRDRDELDLGTDPNDPESFPDASGNAEAVPRAEVRFELVSANPALVSATFRLRLADANPSHLEIHDVQGREVRRLRPAASTGSQDLSWDLRDASGRRVPAGVYFIRLAAGEPMLTRRLPVLTCRCSPADCRCSPAD